VWIDALSTIKVQSRIDDPMTEYVTLRALNGLLGLFALAWASAVFPALLLSAPARTAAKLIVEDDHLQPGGLAKLHARLQNAHLALVPPKLVTAKALVRLRLADEEAQTSQQIDAQRTFDEVNNEIKGALSEVPGDSFLWMMYYSTAVARTGSQFEHIDYLVQSYEAGPNEGWIVLRRNRLGLSLPSPLISVLQKYIVAEFATIANSGFVEDAASNLALVGRDEQELLLAGLSTLDIQPRIALAKKLSRAGIRVAIPGVTQDESWR
jgi:hypothetical protein